MCRTDLLGELLEPLQRGNVALRSSLQFFWAFALARLVGDNPRLLKGEFG